MKTYKFSVKTKGVWLEVCTVQSTGVGDALSQGLRRIGRDFSGMPIKLEQEIDGDLPTRQPLGFAN